MNKKQISARIKEVEARYDTLEAVVGAGVETSEMKALIEEMDVLYKQYATATE